MMKNDYDKKLNKPEKDGRSYNPGRAPVRVIQSTKQGEYIKTFDSVKEAQLETGVDAGSIVKCCRGFMYSAGGYRWSYESEKKKAERRSIGVEVLKRCVKYMAEQDAKNFVPLTREEFKERFEDAGVAADYIYILQNVLLVDQFTGGKWSVWGDSEMSDLWWAFNRHRKEEMEEFIEKLKVMQKAQG